MEGKNKKQDNLVKQVTFGVIGHKQNWGKLIKADSVLGQCILTLDGVKDKKLAEAYWKLDGNAFGKMSAPKFMKLDTLVLGGLVVCMFLHKNDADPALVKELGAEDMEYVPIGFMDLHKVDEKTFSCSGLGIAKPYQGNGLSKYLIHAGVKIGNVHDLTVPTQLSNFMAHYAWLHLGSLWIDMIKPMHEEEDSLVYNIIVAKSPEEILTTKILKTAELLKMKDAYEVPIYCITKHPEKYDNSEDPVIGYTGNSLVFEDLRPYTSACR